MEPPDASTEAAAPSVRMHSPDRTQIDPDPKTIDELIPPDHKARLIWELVLELDMAPLYEQVKAVEGHAGRSIADRRVHTALWLYATEEGIASARELGRRCYDCDPYKWLRGGVDVNHHSLSDFRVNHLDWLKEQVVNNIAAMRAEGLVDLDTLGQDGMKVRASAGNDSFRKAETLERLLEEAEREWGRLQKEFQQETNKRSAREKAAQQRAARERSERLKRAQEEVKKVAEAREKRKKGDGKFARVSTTDPESRRIKMADGGIRPSYNVQFATNLNDLVIVGADLINAGSDAGQMEPMVQQVEEEQEPLSGEYMVDGNFAILDDIESVGNRGVTVFAPVKQAKQQIKKGKDPYAPKPGDKPQVADWRKRMGTEDGQDKYKQRCKCEWSNAQCRNRGLYQFTVRGLERVKAVVLWYVLNHNLFRMVALRAKRTIATATP
jgi:transposase